MSIQDIKERARKSLHDTMSRPARLFLDPTSGVALEITARYHAKPGLVGDLKGTNLSYAENHDDVESVVFWREELIPTLGYPGIPTRGSLVLFTDVEAYWVDNVMPPDGQTIRAEVTRAAFEDIGPILALVPPVP